MIKKIKYWNNKRKTKKQEIDMAVREGRALERAIADEYYTNEMKKERIRHSHEKEDLKNEFFGNMEKQRKEIENRFAVVIVEYENKLKRKERQIKKSQKAWFMINELAHKLYAKSQDSRVSAELIRDSRARDYQKSIRLCSELEALIRVVEKQTPKIEKFLSIKEIKEEEREKLIEGPIVPEIVEEE